MQVLVSRREIYGLPPGRDSALQGFPRSHLSIDNGCGPQGLYGTRTHPSPFRGDAPSFEAQSCDSDLGAMAIWLKDFTLTICLQSELKELNIDLPDWAISVDHRHAQRDFGLPRASPTESMNCGPSGVTTSACLIVTFWTRVPVKPLKDQVQLAHGAGATSEELRVTALIHHGPSTKPQNLLA